jgi:hypothetical protein
VPVTSTSPSDRGALSGLAAGVRFIAGVAGAMALADLPYPRPGADPTQIRTYFSQNAGPARLSAAGQAISAVALARFTASVATLAGRSGRGSRALQAAAVAGGGVAAASLAVASACAAALTGPSGRQDASAAALARRGFIAGGPVHAVGFGVLLGALGLATHRRAAPTAGHRRAGLSNRKPAVPAVLRGRAGRVVHPDRTVFRPAGQRHRRGPARQRRPGSPSMMGARSWRNR